MGCGRVRVGEGERRKGEKGKRKGEVKIETIGKGRNSGRKNQGKGGKAKMQMQVRDCEITHCLRRIRIV